jgi:hypothetical protein
MLERQSNFLSRIRKRPVRLLVNLLHWREGLADHDQEHCAGRYQDARLRHSESCWKRTMFRGVQIKEVTSQESTSGMSA